MSWLPSKSLGFGWTPIPEAEVAAWNSKLLATSAHYRQYPYWCEPYRQLGKLTPRFYAYVSGGRDVAYVSILEGSVAGMRFGLIQRGPVSIATETVNANMIRELIHLGRENQYAFMRFTHSDALVTAAILSVRGSHQRESFPYYRDPPRSLIVTQVDDDAAMLASFQSVARREIGYAEKAGYVIEATDSLTEYRKVWPMFSQLASRKDFDLSTRGLDAWLDVIARARVHGCSQLYTASIGGDCVSAIHLLRYGNTVEFMLGALDVALLGKRPSPSALLHWRAMRDFHRSGCGFYNLGGPGDGVHNKVYSFKRKFRPELRLAEAPVTVVLNPVAFLAWELLALKGWPRLKRIARGGLRKGRVLMREVLRKTSVHPEPPENSETP